MCSKSFAITVLPLLCALAQSPTQAQTMPDEWAGAVQWRSIGPANMSGRITDFAVYGADPTIWYAATASGGLLKTVNDGTTFEHQFDRESAVSIGAVTVAATDPDIVWVGTGEANPRNSVSWGDGVYKSADGGKTWEHKGLRETFQIGALVIHPENPDIVFVGAMGRLWGTNTERGLYKTSDGGDSWEQILFIDEKTGVIDVAMHPQNPDIMLCAMWERQRDEFDTNDPSKRHGPGSGLYRTTDGGATWGRINAGLPTVNLGRLGIDWSRSEENTVYMLVDSERIGEGIPNAGYAGLTGENADAGARIRSVVEDGPAAEAELREGDIVVELDGVNIARYDDLLSEVRVHEAGATAPLTVVRDGEIVELEITFAKNPNPDQKPFVQDIDGQRANIMDQQGEDGFETGGLYKSTDGGVTWTRVNSVNPRPMYFSEVRVDPQDAKHQWVLGVVMQTSEDGGETFERRNGSVVHADHHAMWIDPRDGRHAILGTDGGIYVTRDRGETWDHLNNVAIGQFYHASLDNQPLYRVYGGLQDNGTWGAPNRTRTRTGPDNTDWFRVGGGDGFLTTVDPDDPDQIYASSQNGSTTRYNIRTGEQQGIRPRAPRGSEYRFNWRTPFALSHFNHRIYYSAGNYVFRSIDRGNGIEAISPEITRTNRGAATAFAESPLDVGVLYVGTDDGSLWVMREGFAWSNIIYPREPDPEPEAEEPEADAAEPAEAHAETEGEPEPEAQAEEPKADAAEPGEAQAEAEEEPESRAEPEAPEPDAAEQGDAQAEEQPERPAGREGGRGAAAFFERLDTNGDGKLSGDEIPERMREMVGGADTNGDGTVTQAELAGAMQRRAGPGGGPGAGGRPGAGDRPGAPGGRGPGQQQQAQGQRPGGPAQGRRGEGQQAGSVGVRPITIVPLGGEPGPREQATRDPGDPIAGEWLVKTVSDRGESEMTIFVKRLEDGSLELFLTSQFMDESTKDVAFNAESMTLTFSLSTDFGASSGTGTVEGEEISGTLSFGDGRFTAEFTGTRTPIQEPGEIQEPNLGEFLPGPGRFTSIEASRHSASRVYITVDRHYYDDTKPYALVSEDYGLTWRSIAEGLPDGSAKVIREDLQNPRVLYLGTEFGLWISIDGGESWTSLNTNLPTVAVFEVAQHPSNGDLLVATHGRSLWITNVAPLRGLDERALSSPAYLLPVQDVVRWHTLPSQGDAGGDHWYTGENPATEAQICFLVKGIPRNFSLRISNLDGRIIREFGEVEVTEGLNSLRWDLRESPPAGGAQGRSRRAPLVPTGGYRVDLEIDGMHMTRSFSVLPDPVYGQ